jgi:Arc/MetJ-type ribon-helix-helix transcriptional regulator
MSYQLPADINARVQSQLATGEFATVDDVLREALETLERRQRSLASLQQMVRQAEEDVAAGRIGYFDVDATMQAVEARLSAMRSGP